MRALRAMRGLLDRLAAMRKEAARKDAELYPYGHAIFPLTQDEHDRIHGGPLLPAPEKKSEPQPIHSGVRIAANCSPLFNKD